jgi:hypothetical protein
LNPFLFLRQYFNTLNYNITKQTKMKKLFIAWLFIWILNPGFSQQNFDYFPNTVKAAIGKGTRTNSGLPGENYWINSSDYEIDVEVEPHTGMIYGSARITYFNNSPDTLKSIVFRLYQNIYKKGNSRQFAIGEADLTDGMEISKLTIGNSDIDIKSRKVYFSATNMIVMPDIPVLPGSEKEIEIQWNFKMPQKRWIRFGQYSKNHLFVAYWYPQIAVYDDIDGWDMVEYAGMAEYYNDLNNYKVNITIPGNFVVWATGELQNAGDVFPKDILDKYDVARSSDEVIQIIARDDYNRREVTLSAEKHTWEFRADSVPDFAFAASSGSSWDAVSLVVEPETGRRVLISAVYPDSAIHYEDVALISRNAVEYMSFELPGTPYPYPQATVFANGRKTGGMEFPMIANDGAPDDYNDLTGLTFHEIFHNYFPFFMGTNERKYAFMDEGWARYLPMGFLEKYAPEDNYFQRSISQYERFAGSENELPPMIPTYIFNDYQTQRMAAYTRPAVAYFLLHQMLGDEVFKNAMTEFIHRWQGKHPTPFDFFNTFNAIAGEDLSWFWNPWFFERGYPDLAILSLSDNNVLSIEKRGAFPVPVEAEVAFEDGSVMHLSENARIWADGKKVVSLPLPEDKKIKRIVLGNDLIPDTNRIDNVITGR